MKKFNLILYGIFGLVSLAYGAAALLWPELEGTLSEQGRHILRESGASSIFIGLMCFWCIFHYSQRKAVHYCLMVFALLLSLIHWADYFKGHRPLASPLYNSLPLFTLSLMVLLSRSEGKTTLSAGPTSRSRPTVATGRRG